MFKKLNPQKVLFGYPNLGHPNNHFNITHFEAIYCVPQTYEHIKMQASIEDNSDLDEIFLVHNRNFVVNEIESDVVYLQNKTIGKNLVQYVPSCKYFKPGTHFKASSKVHAKIEYWPCQRKIQIMPYPDDLEGAIP